MEGQLSIKKWGNSNGLLLSKQLLDSLGWTTTDVLEADVVGEELHLKKAFRHRTLRERMAEYGGKMEVEPFDWGEPKGKEML